MESALTLILVLVFLSSAILTTGALRALARDLRARIAAAARPDARDLAVDAAMLVLGLGGMALAGRALL